MNYEASRIFISKVNSKFFKQKFTLSQVACVDTNPHNRVFCLRLVVVFLSPKKALKCVLATL